VLRIGRREQQVKPAGGAWLMIASAGQSMSGSRSSTVKPAASSAGSTAGASPGRYSSRGTRSCRRKASINA